MSSNIVSDMFYPSPFSFPVTCPSGFTYLSQVPACYYVNPTTLNWLEAGAECVRLGGYLVEVLSECEAAAMMTLNMTGTWYLIERMSLEDKFEEVSGTFLIVKAPV